MAVVFKETVLIELAAFLRRKDTMTEISSDSFEYIAIPVLNTSSSGLKCFDLWDSRINFYLFVQKNIMRQERCNRETEQKHQSQSSDALSHNCYLPSC